MSTFDYLNLSAVSVPEISYMESSNLTAAFKRLTINLLHTTGQSDDCAF